MESCRPMHAIVNHLFAIFIKLGAFGLLILGVLDSSFLVLPFGNDLLLVALTARDHSRLPIYAVMATAGSVLGCVLMDLIARKGGEEGLKRIIPARRLEYVECKIRKSAGWALVFASVMPPPFPFTPFVAAAAAFQYPRRKMFTVIAGARLARFFAVGLLAVLFGPGILRVAESRVAQIAILALVVFCVGASAVSIYSWIKRSRA
jgi:membrane protein YqaA with SNARE-associated domain